MANICEYRVIVKGKKNACYAFYGSMSCMDYIDIVGESGDFDDYTLQFSGNCKWSVDSYCKPWEGDIPVSLPDDEDEALSLANDKFWYHTIRERSAMFEVEVWCNSCDIEGDPETALFEHYKNGEPISDELPDELSIEGTTNIVNAAEQASMQGDLVNLLEQLNDLVGSLADLFEEDNDDEVDDN